MAWGIPDAWSNFLGDLFNPNSKTARNTKNVISGIPLVGTPAAWQLGQWGYGNLGNKGSSQAESLTHPGIVSAPSRNAGITGSTGFSLLDKLNREHGYQYFPAQPQQPQQPQNTPLPTLEEALARAKGLLGASGWNPGYIDVNSISWDPLRKDARGRANEYDAKVASMYNALQNSVRTDDAKAIQQNFEQNRDAVKASTDDTVAQLQQAAAAANDANRDNLAALGLGDAAARIIEQGQDANTRASQNVADALARGQASQDAVSRKQQASGDYNTQMAGAYGLQGAETRDNIQSQLSSLLANYAMAEQQARAQAQQQNASLKQNEQNVLMSLANQVLGNQWNTVKYNDSLSQQQYQNAMDQYTAQQEALQAQQQAAQDQANRQQALDTISRLTGINGQSSQLSLDDALKYVNGLSGLKKFMG